MLSGISSVSSKSPKQCYEDILDAINAIQSFTAGMEYEDFRTDPKTVAAVERKFLVIAEAAVRLRGEPLPEQPWRDIRNMGNYIRHQYDAVTLPTIWDTVERDLEPLRSMVMKNLAGPSTEQTES